MSPFRVRFSPSRKSHLCDGSYFLDIQMLNAQNGVRIKSWAGPNVGSGLVKNICEGAPACTVQYKVLTSIAYSHWQEDNIDNPVIIDSCCACSVLYWCPSNTDNSSPTKT